MKEMSNFIGSEEYSDRTAKVLWDDDNQLYYVDMKMNTSSELRPLPNHSVTYAEDCAENFVMGYGEFAI